MKKTTILNICKWLCLLLCACFLLTSCGDGNWNEAKQSYNETKESDQASLITTEKAGLDAEGEDIQKITQYHHFCIVGPVLKTVYTGLGEMTTDVYKTLTAENLLSLVILAFTVWMAFQILQHISSTTPESIGEFWTKVLRKAAICTACGVLASTPENIMYVVNTFIFPVYVTILEFTALIMKHLGSLPEAKTTAIKLWGVLMDDSQICTEFVHRIGEEGCNFDGLAKVEMTTSSFPTGPLEMMSCMACSVSDRLSMGTDIGLRLLMHVWPLTTIIVGIFILCIFLIARLSFAMYLIDSIFRLNMMIVILPFLIMFYPFEQTRKWSIKGFQIILSSAAIMMCIGLIVTMTVFAMEKLLIDKNMHIPYGSEKEYLSWSVIAMSLLFMAMIIKQACSMGVELAGRITGYSGDSGFAKNVTGVIHWLGRLGLAAATFGAGMAWSWFYQRYKFIRDTQRVFEKAKNKAENIAARVNHAAGRDRE